MRLRLTKNVTTRLNLKKLLTRNPEMNILRLATVCAVVIPEAVFSCVQPERAVRTHRDTAESGFFTLIFRNSRTPSDSKSLTGLRGMKRYPVRRKTRGQFPNNPDGWLHTHAGGLGQPNMSIRHRRGDPSSLYFFNGVGGGFWVINPYSYA